MASVWPFSFFCGSVLFLKVYNSLQGEQNEKFSREQHKVVLARGSESLDAQVRTHERARGQ